VAPIAFLSKSLFLIEQNYKIHDKEMLAIVRVLEEWRHFVEGAEHCCEIWTDHKNLQYFMTAKKLNRRQARWSLLLAQFDFIMHHHPGKSMGKTDAVKLGVRTEMSGLKSCEALASTCRLRRSLAGCLKFRRSGRSRRVRNRAEEKLKKDESELRKSRLLS